MREPPSDEPMSARGAAAGRPGGRMSPCLFSPCAAVSSKGWPRGPERRSAAAASPRTLATPCLASAYIVAYIVKKSRMSAQSWPFSTGAHQG
jgi:hypothetical protein